jgi:N-acetylglucosamine kinase-like BadF-type ATPase
MRFFLGIDGGQSSTTALIGDETGHIRGSGSGGPCNHVGAAEGRTKFLNAIGSCVSAARAMAHLPDDIEFAAVCAGFSGGPADKEALLRELLRTPCLQVTTDALIALSGAMAGEPGIIVIAGTGSIAYGRNADGKVARAGGWGYVYGDEGGGFDLARQAVRAALRYEEGWGPATALHALLLEETGGADANDMLHRLYTTDFPRPKIAALSKVVDLGAMNGDVVARTLLTNAAQQLATFAAAARSQLFEPRTPVKIAYIGGVYRSGLLLDRFRTLVELEDGNQAMAPYYGPAAGALIEAYRAAGLKPVLTNFPEAEK